MITDLPFWDRRWSVAPFGGDGLLDGGDGSARFAVEFRRCRPAVTDAEVIAAVDEYRHLVADVIVAPAVDLRTWQAARFRQVNPGCSFAEVAAAVARVRP